MTDLLDKLCRVYGVCCLCSDSFQFFYPTLGGGDASG